MEEIGVPGKTGCLESESTTTGTRRSMNKMYGQCGKKNSATTKNKSPVALFTKILTIKNCRKCKTKIKKSFTKILTIILRVKIVLTLRVKLPCPKCKILIVREILVLSFIVSEKNRKKDGRCIGAST